ncbi:MAG: nitroreductase family protein [Chloroflexi bacterium]|nr:nitroreductase family protein [Chloroflexota bacterium]
MEVYDCIRSRRTVRNFKPDPVPDRVLNRILRAGRWAPSSSNVQPWHFIVIKNPATIQTMGGIATQGTFLGQAPLAIAIVMEDAARPQLDAGRVIQQMELVAWSEGLGTCFVGLRAEEQQVALKELLGIPSEMELITILPFGYREEGFTGRGVARKSMAEIAHSEKFGQSYTTA